MRRKWLIFMTGGLSGVLVLVVWLTPTVVRSPIAFAVEISRPAGGDETRFRASITNTTSGILELSPTRVTYTEENGYELSTDYVRLAGGGTPGGLPPQAFDSVELRGSDPIRGVRIRFDYRYDADPVRQVVSEGLKRLGLRPQLGDVSFPWMLRNGLVDGRVHRRYDGTWLPSLSPKGKLLQEAEKYFSTLEGQNKLPGYGRKEHWSVVTSAGWSGEDVPYPASVTVHAWRLGADFTFGYALVKDTQKSQWRLVKAIRLDKDDQVVEQLYPK